MTILGVCWKAVPFKDGYKLQGDTLKMIPGFNFPDDTDFGFDVMNPKNWQKFLEEYKLPDGSRLPRKSSEGYPIAYRVYTTLKVNGKRLYTYFPGYVNGKKLLVKQYGYLK